MANRNMTVDDMEPTMTLEDLLTVLKEFDACEEFPVDLTNLSVELSDETPAAIMVMVKDNSILVGHDKNFVWLKYPEETVEEMMESVAPPTLAIGKAQKPVVKAVKPVKGKDGQNVTVPVSEGSTERRELDASKGERVIAEEDMRDVIKSLKAQPKPSWQNEEHESKIEELPEVPMLCPPDGVPANIWELAYNANTEAARSYWKAYVDKLINGEQMEIPF